MVPAQPSQVAALKRNALIRWWGLGAAVAIYLFNWRMDAVSDPPRETCYGANLTYFIAWFLAAMAINALFYFSWNRKGTARWAYYSEPLFDLLVITVLCSLTGGMRSPFLGWYFLVAFLAAMNSTPATARVYHGLNLVAVIAAEKFAVGTEDVFDWELWLSWSVFYFCVAEATGWMMHRFKMEASRYQHLHEIQMEADNLLIKGFTVDGLMSRMLERVVALFGFQHGAVLVYDPEARELVLRASIHISAEAQLFLKRQPVGPGAQGVGVYAAMEKRTTFIHNPAENQKLPPLIRKTFEGTQTSRLASVPMLVDGELAGVVLLSSTGSGQKVADEEIAFLEFVCRAMATVARHGAFLEKSKAGRPGKIEGAP